MMVSQLEKDKYLILSAMKKFTILEEQARHKGLANVTTLE